MIPPYLLRILLIGLILATARVPVAVGMNDDTELLPEDEAFAFSAELLPGNMVLVRWDIADGYYMYRDKMGYEIVGDTAHATTPDLPAGTPKHDPLFGDVEVYTGSFEMEFPVAVADAPFTLLANGQGCNEPVGVCYPPMLREITFQPGVSVAPAAQPASAAGDLAAIGGMGGSLDGFEVGGGDVTAGVRESSTTGSVPTAAGSEVMLAASDGTAEDGADPVAELRSLLQPAAPDPAEATENQDATNVEDAGDDVTALRKLLDAGFEQPEFLPPEEAFPFTVRVLDDNRLEARFEVVEGYYLYRDKLGFEASGDARVATFDLPEGEEKHDEFFGLSVVYKEPFTVPVTLQRDGPGAGNVTIEAAYQGCADQGICYPPLIQTASLALPALVGDAAAATTGDSTGSAPASSGAAFSLPGAGAVIGSGSLLGILAGALVAGLLLAFTPCVLPMIPILSGVIAGQGESLTRMRGGMLALVYVAGTAITYAAMGWIAGATGEQLQAYFQNAWAIGILATIFFLMALSMFGLYEIQLPSAIQSRLYGSTSGMGGSVSLVFVLGLVSALVVGACVSPILISFLGIAVTQGDPVLGAQMMFVMALGMGAPLVALGFGAGYLLPRAGAWMNLVRYFFGVMLIAVSIYLLGVLPAVPVLLLWGVFFIVLSTYLGATQSLPEGASGWRQLTRGAGTVLLIWGIAALVGGFYGERDLLKPLPAQLLGGGGGGVVTPAEATHLFTRVSNTEELDRELARARDSGKGVVLDYYADWCVDCVRMEKTTFQDPAVVAELESRYVALQVDVTDPRDPGPKAVKQRFGVFGPPAVLFFDTDGNPLREKNFYGYLEADKFLTLIER